MSQRTVGMIGIGLLGSAIADRLIKTDYDVWGHDAASSAMLSFAQSGGRPILKISDVPLAAQHIILSLPNSGIVERVLVQILPRLRPGMVIIDTTTGDPQVTLQLARRLDDIDVTLIDAAVLGSSKLARCGQAVLLVGCEAETLQTCEPVLSAISEKVIHVGPVGSGQKMKLVANLVLGLNRAVLAEGLHFAESLELEPNTVLEVLKSGAAYSQVMDAKGRKMIDREFTAVARLSQHLKDVRLILEHAAKSGTKLPLSRLHCDLLQSVDEEHGGLDNSAIIKAWNNQQLDS